MKSRKQTQAEKNTLALMFADLVKGQGLAKATQIWADPKRRALINSMAKALAWKNE